MRLPRLVGGDPLRAVAALSVLLYHAALFAVPGADSDQAVADRLGAGIGDVAIRLGSGLFLFFALSGYLIARPFVRAARSGGPRPSLRAYARNRALRILPPFWVIFTIVLVAHAGAGAGFWDIASVYLLAQNFHPSSASDLIVPAWTLGTEACFYALVGAAAALLWHRRGVVPLIAVAALVSLWATYQTDSLSFERSIAVTFCIFAPGIAVILLDGRRVPRGAPLALAAAGIYALFVLGYSSLGALATSAGAGAILAAVLLAQEQPGGLWRVVDNGPLHWLGRCSYSIYLLHWPVISELADIFGGGRPVPRFLFFATAGGAITIALAGLSHRFIEQPFLARKARRV